MKFVYDTTTNTLLSADNLMIGDVDPYEQTTNEMMIQEIILQNRPLHKITAEWCDDRAEVERLTARLKDAEEALVALQPDPVLVEGSWIPFRDLATVCGNFMRSSAEHARAAKAAHVRVAELEATVENLTKNLSSKRPTD